MLASGDRSDQAQRLHSLFEQYFRSLGPQDELRVMESDFLNQGLNQQGVHIGGQRSRRPGESGGGAYVYNFDQGFVSSMELAKMGFLVILYDDLNFHVIDMLAIPSGSAYDADTVAEAAQRVSVPWSLILSARDDVFKEYKSRNGRKEELINQVGDVPATLSFSSKQ